MSKELLEDKLDSYNSHDELDDPMAAGFGSNDGGRWLDDENVTLYSLERAEGMKE